MGHSRTARIERGLARASTLNTTRVITTVVLPLAARGVLLRRPPVVALAERLDADRRAVHLLQRLRARYGPGLLRLRVPGRSVALVLSPRDVQRVLSESPESFTVANREKRGALSHFQPHGVLVSHGRLRTDRRRVNEAVLDSHRPVHRLAEAIAAKVLEEARPLLPDGSSASLPWDEFAVAWWRAVRRVVLGDAARNDHELTDLLAQLRAAANWSSLRPKRTRVRARFLQRLGAYLEEPEPGSLAELVARTPSPAGTDPGGQVPQWLFAFDATGMATFQTLALLATHPAQLDRVRSELAGKDLSTPQDLAYLRSCVQESVRLWPTTPAILRDTTSDTTWDSRVLPAGTALVIYAPYFHRDERRLPYADQFTPEIWLDARAQHSWSLVPFSAGPAECAGRHLALLVATTLLAVLLEGHEFRLLPPASLDPQRPLPGTLNLFALRFQMTPSS
jgi:cytochrome P450